MRQRRANTAGDRLLMILTGLFLYAPIIILIVFSFNAGNSSSVWKGFSLHWYQQLFQNRLIMHSVYITLLVSLLPRSSPPSRAPLPPSAFTACAARPGMASWPSTTSP